MLKVDSCCTDCLKGLQEMGCQAAAAEKKKTKKKKKARRLVFFEFGALLVVVIVCLISINTKFCQARRHKTHHRTAQLIDAGEWRHVFVKAPELSVASRSLILQSVLRPSEGKFCLFACGILLAS